MSALDRLRLSTHIDLDSLDVSVAQKYGPFVDCTSNQAIVWFELQKPQHERLLQSAVKQARELEGRFDNVNIVELTVEIVTISLALSMLPYLTGRIHIQANTTHSTSTDHIVCDALRLRALIRIMDPDFDTSRLCIKIPSTWEGLQACRILKQQHSMRTLATTLFGVPQILMAGDVGCDYIAPYLHSLPDVLSNTLRNDHVSVAELDKTLHLIITTQAYFKQFEINTSVLPAALMTKNECCVLEGVNHMTLSPFRIEELANHLAPNVVETNGDNWQSLFLAPKSDSQVSALETELKSLSETASMLRLHECQWRKSMETADQGSAQRKTDEAIKIFNDMQRNLEQMAHFQLALFGALQAQKVAEAISRQPQTASTAGSKYLID